LAISYAPSVEGSPARAACTWATRFWVDLVLVAGRGRFEGGDAHRRTRGSWGRISNADTCETQLGAEWLTRFPAFFKRFSDGPASGNSGTFDPLHPLPARGSHPSAQGLRVGRLGGGSGRHAGGPQTAPRGRTGGVSGG
jgi:hypothetical protein